MHSAEYIALVGSFMLVGLEAIIRILTLALRSCTISSSRLLADQILASTIIQLCYRASRRLFNRFTSPAEKKRELRNKSMLPRPWYGS